MKESKDYIIIKKIINHCELINDIKTRLNNSEENFNQDDGLACGAKFHLCQIAELTNQLSEEAKTDNPQIPWSPIRKMRDLLMHHYSKQDPKIIWFTIKNDIPYLKDQLSKYLEKNTD